MILYILLIWIATGAAIGFTLLFWIIRSETRYAPRKADCLILLGARVTSHTFLYRKQKTLQLYKRGIAQNIIATGGKGKREPLAESVSAVHYLLRHGVPYPRIRFEQKSGSTWENLLHARRIMRQNGWETAVIVTTGYHLSRAMCVAKKLYVSASGAAALAYSPEKWYHRFREVIGIVYYFLRRRI